MSEKTSEATNSLTIDVEDKLKSMYEKKEDKGSKTATSTQTEVENEYISYNEKEVKAGEKLQQQYLQ